MVQEEKRNFVRVPCVNIISYSRQKDDGTLDALQSGFVQCKDISLGGISFESYECYPEGTLLQLKLRIDLPDGRNDDVSMTGEVLRCDEIKEDKEWSMAVSIRFIETEKRRSFLDWLFSKIEKE